jgi:hypothetical protein
LQTIVTHQVDVKLRGNVRGPLTALYTLDLMGVIVYAMSLLVERAQSARQLVFTLIITMYLAPTIVFFWKLSRKEKEVDTDEYMEQVRPRWVSRLFYLGALLFIGTVVASVFAMMVYAGFDPHADAQVTWRPDSSVAHCVQTTSTTDTYYPIIVEERAQVPVSSSTAALLADADDMMVRDLAGCPLPGFASLLVADNSTAEIFLDPSFAALPIEDWVLGGGQNVSAPLSIGPHTFKADVRFTLLCSYARTRVYSGKSTEVDETYGEAVDGSLGDVVFPGIFLILLGAMETLIELSLRVGPYAADKVQPAPPRKSVDEVGPPPPQQVTLTQVGPPGPPVQHGYAHGQPMGPSGYPPVQAGHPHAYPGHAHHQQPGYNGHAPISLREV